ncbi:hypothetical protein DENSPDRAFT_90276 [Dentipellis sp. KUC8613]|nr:hypothetical protein DENSPDRAFT_90276 [Dentipellis sp. KUC8613]
MIVHEFRAHRVSVGPVSPAHLSVFSSTLPSLLIVKQRPRTVALTQSPDWSAPQRVAYERLEQHRWGLRAEWLSVARIAPFSRRHPAPVSVHAGDPFDWRMVCRTARGSTANISGGRGWVRRIDGACRWYRVLAVVPAAKVNGIPARTGPRNSC